MSGPFWTDEAVTLWHGDCREVLPNLLEQPAAAVVDPPYGETSAAWDVWPDGWVRAVASALPADTSLWCFGSARMFLDRAGDFAGWRFAQELLWLKRNGTGPGSRAWAAKVHEWAYHWYRGQWDVLHHEWEREKYYGSNKGYVRKDSPAASHQRERRKTAWQDDGTRQPRSIAHLTHDTVRDVAGELVAHLVESPSVRGRGRHQDEKPLAVVVPLVRECTPPGGLVLDPFAGTGTTGLAARMTGRRAVLIEADEAMCEKAATRLSEDDLTTLWGVS